MTHRACLIFDFRKIYFFGILIAGMYGLSPAISVCFFGGEAPRLDQYLTNFIICAAFLFLVIFPPNHRIYCQIEVNETRMTSALVLLGFVFVIMQIAVYGDFTQAFVVAYTERTGVEFEGGVQFIFYPILVAYTSTVLFYSLYLYARWDRVNFRNAFLLAISVLIFSALGSRNLLLWSFSAAAAIFVSKLRYRHVFLIPFFIYLAAVLFAFARNAGLIAYLTNTTDTLGGILSLEYFDPMIHEFGSSYRTFIIISTSYSAEQQLATAPYGLLSSFLLNQLPSFFKPEDFISFTNYISHQFAEPGEGIGSSPMTEFHLFNIASLLLLLLIGIIVFWPLYYGKRMLNFRFFCYALAIAIFFNIWRIGTAEIMKMFLSSVVTLLLLAPICGFRVSHLRSTNRILLV